MKLFVFHFSLFIAAAAFAGWNDVANEFGALVDLKVRAVCEDTGEPLPGVRLRWESRTPDGLEFPVTVRATTDANGDARLRGLSFGGVNPFRSDRHFILSAPVLAAEGTGVWGLADRIPVGDPDTNGVWSLGRSWFGDGTNRLAADGTLRLRRVLDPRPLAESGFSVSALPRGKAVGYDALEGDFLPPYGAGRTADFLVGADFGSPTGGPIAYGHFALLPASPDDALLAVPARGDALRTPRAAPADGWRAEPVRYEWSFRPHDVSHGRAFARTFESPPDVPAPDESQRHRLLIGDVVLFRSRTRRAPDGSVASALVGAVFTRHDGEDGHTIVREGEFVVRLNPDPASRSLEPEALVFHEPHAEGAEVEPHAESAEAGGAGVSPAEKPHAESADPARSPKGLRVEPVPLGPPLGGVPVIPQTPRPALPPEAGGDAARSGPQPEVFRFRASGSELSWSARSGEMGPADVPTNVLFRADELDALFAEPPGLAVSNALQRAFALDWLDRFDEAWALLRSAAESPDADPELLLLFANYLRYGRPGVSDLLDPGRPGFYRAELQDEADAQLRRIVARGMREDATPHEMVCAARARLLLRAASPEEAARAREETLELIRRTGALSTGRRTHDQMFAFLLRNLASPRFCGDPGTLPCLPAPWHGFSSIPGPGDREVDWKGDRHQPLFHRAKLREQIRRWRGADAMAYAGSALCGAESSDWHCRDLSLEPDPAWGEWWLRRAAIRGNAAARACFPPDFVTTNGPAFRPERFERGGRLVLTGSPGAGAGGWIEPYASWPELDAECAKYGLRPFWFRRDPPPANDPAGEIVRRMNATAVSEDPQTTKWANTALPERLPLLLFLPDPSVCTGAVPLVVYLPGNGEQGTNLVKQFRQTACIAKVTSEAFQSAHPAALLVPMPPDWANHNVPDGWPREPFGPQAELFSDLVLAVARSAPALGGPAVDPARIHLTGLGSGGAIAAGMSFDHPGRFASVSGAWFSPYCDPSPERPGAWWIAQEDKDRDEDEQLEWERILARRVKPFQTAVRAAGGACEYREYPPLPDGGWWWDRMWRDDESFWDWMLAQRSEGEIDPTGVPLPRFLFGHAEGDSHAEFAEGAEGKSHAEFAENAEGDSHAELAESAETPAARANLRTFEPPNLRTSEQPSPVFLASLASDGTAIFWGTESDGVCAPPTFAASARFRAGEAASTPLAVAERLVFLQGRSEIPAGAFAGLPALRSVVIPASVRAIGARAFADCPALESVVFLGDGEVSIAADAFAGASRRLVAWFARRTVSDPVSLSGTPFPVVRGLGPGPNESFPDWALPGGSARYVGLRVEGGCAYHVLADGTTHLIRTLDPGAVPPGRLAPLTPSDDSQLWPPRSVGEWLVHHLSEEAAQVFSHAGTNLVASVPSESFGIPVRRISSKTFLRSPAIGVRVPASVSAYSSTAPDEDSAPGFEDSRIEALWLDGGVLPGFAPRPDQLLYAPRSAPRAAPGARRLPDTTDVGSLLARGRRGPPRAAAPGGPAGQFEYVPLVGGREAAIVGLAVRPSGDRLEIPATLDGLRVVEIADGAFSPCDDTVPTAELFGVWRRETGPAGDETRFSGELTVVVPEGVRRIGERAFAGFLPLRELSLPSTLQEIGSEAFADCAALRSAVLPTAVRRIPSGAFRGCSALRSVTVEAEGPHVALWFPPVRIGPLAFAVCPELDAVFVPHDPSDATVDPSAFRDSPRAKVVKAPASEEASDPSDPFAFPFPPVATGAADPPTGESDSTSSPRDEWSYELSSDTRHSSPFSLLSSHRIAERFGHPATATVTVVDANGAPVPDAWVEWSFPATLGACRFGVDSVEGLTRADSNGVVRVEGPHFGWFFAILVDPATGMRFAFNMTAADQRAPGPFDFALTLADTPEAREFGAKNGKRSWWSDAEGWRSEAFSDALLDEAAVDALFALDGAPVGLDLARRAFLPPIGDGETADCHLRAFRHWPEDSGLALEGIEVMLNAECTMHNGETGTANANCALCISHCALTNGNSSLYLRALPPWSNGRRRRVGHLLPPPCDWSSTNGWTGAAPAPWRAVTNAAPLRVPVRSRGAEGWVEIGPDSTRWSGLHVSGFLPVERKPFARVPGIEECRIWRGVAPQRGFLAVGKTVDGAACLLGPCDNGSDPCAPSSFPGASRIALFAQSSDAPDFLAGVDTLYVPGFVEEVPDRAFENCGDLRCVVLEPGVRRIGARAFAGCTNLAAVLVLPGPAGDKIAFPEVAPDAFSDCAGTPEWIVSAVRGIDVANVPLWHHTPQGLSYAGPRVLDGWLWRATRLSVSYGRPADARPAGPPLPAGTLSVIPPSSDSDLSTNSSFVIRHSSLGNARCALPSAVAGHPVHYFDADRLPETVAEIELPPTLRCADFPGRVPDVIRTTDPATELNLYGRKPRLLFFPPGRYELYPFGVNVGLTRLLPADADLAAQLAVPHQNRDCGGWLWIPVGDDAAQLVGYRGPLPTNGVLRLPAFVGPEDRLPAAPSDPPTLRPSDHPTTRPPDPQTNASARPARRVVSVSPYVFRRPDASAERERGPRFALEIPEGVETIGAFAFENTLRIESVRLPSTLRSLGPGAFSNCGNLKEIDLPEGVKEIPAGCFLGCAALERVSAPGAAEIDALAFAGCERLANLRLPTDPRPVFHPSATLDCPALRRK